MEQKLTFPDIPTSAYIHIPFCRRRCFYCDFPIFVVGNTLRGENSLGIDQYVKILCQEINTTRVYGQEKSQKLNTIFFGGGTPSLLSTFQLQQIIEALDKRFGIASGAEISMEMDPGTFDFVHIHGYKKNGVNRVSLGIQAFQDKLLEACGRTHRVKDIFPAIELLAQVGVSEFSVDLISGLPHQTLEIWNDSLVSAISLKPTHISIYDLTIEPGTAFGRYYKPGDRPLPTDESTVEMYKIGQQVLTSAGFDHYEISNYALPGHQCRHNRVYWENRPYYGFGMGAASYVEGKRFSRPRKTQEYYNWVEDFIKNDGFINYPITKDKDILLETLMLGLRLAEGLDLSIFIEKFGKETWLKVLKYLQIYSDKKWVEVKDGRVRLTDPEGFLFSNVVLGKLFQEL
jgi:putative oxygen-independent coproporphyrinogen III oxidase